MKCRGGKKTGLFESILLTEDQRLARAMDIDIYIEGSADKRLYNDSNGFSTSPLLSIGLEISVLLLLTDTGLLCANTRSLIKSTGV